MFCYLQIRILCELIAIGCLVAHGDLPGIQTTRLRKSWNADDIIREMGKLHPDFYPIPVLEIQIEPNKRDLQEIKSGFLTKSELSESYGHCGNVLHSGNAKNVHLPRQVGSENFEDIFQITQKIVTLMDHHMMRLLDGEILVCAINMFNPAAVYVAFGKKNP